MESSGRNGVIHVRNRILVYRLLNPILLLPRFVRHRARQGVTMRPVAEREATWHIVVAWQPGRVTGALQALLDAFASEGIKNKK